VNVSGISLEYERSNEKHLKSQGVWYAINREVELKRNVFAVEDKMMLFIINNQYNWQCFEAHLGRRHRDQSSESHKKTR
jgi:hypothetical protein